MARNGTHKRSGNEEVVIVLSGEGSGQGGSLAKIINEELMSAGVAISDDMQEVFDEIGKEGAKRLRDTSPVNPKGSQSGRYAKGWTYERGKRTSNYKSNGVIRNKTDPQLTHLLEYGHPIIRNGEKVGQSDPVEHIRPVADWVADEIENRLSKRLGGN